jgi:type II secretory pathway pseudopilin PulG
VLSRHGASLVELLVAMTLAAVVLGAATTTVSRQRRDADAHAAHARAESQLRAALGEMQSTLEGLSPGAGDLAAGEARDTAVQLRIVVATAIACDSSAGHVTVAADDTSENRASGFAAAPRVGDTVWWHPPGGASWLARRVIGTSVGSGVCAIAGAGVQPTLRLAFAAADTVPRAAPIRLTRQTRFSFYHAGDGSWQLGIAEWSDVLHAFAPPQPVAGPFTRIAPGGARTGFRYFDAAGVELPAGGNGADVASIARVRVSVIAPVRAPGGPDGSYRRDSVDVALNHAP